MMAVMAGPDELFAGVILVASLTACYQHERLRSHTDVLEANPYSEEPRPNYM